MNRQTSLNGGTKHHPLSAFAWGILERLRSGPIPCREINAGVLDRLGREPGPIVETVDLPSPYKTGPTAGKTAPHLRLTPQGLELLKNRPR